MLRRCLCVLVFYAHIRPAAVPRMNNAAAGIWLQS